MTLPTVLWAAGDSPPAEKPPAENKTQAQRHLLNIEAETDDQTGQDLPCKAPSGPSNLPALGAERWMEPAGQIVSLDTGLRPRLSTGCSFGHLNMGTTSNYWCEQRRVTTMVKGLEGEN